MAKEAGMGWTTCEVDDSGAVARDLKNDVLSLDFSTPRGVQDITGLDSTSHERLLLLGDFSCNLSGVFNDAANASFDVFKDVIGTSVTRTVTLVISAQTLAQECVAPDCQYSRSADGSFTWTAPLQLQDGSFAAWA